MADLYICKGGNNCGSSPKSSQLTKLPKHENGKINSLVELGDKLFYQQTEDIAGCAYIYKKYNKNWAKYELSDGRVFYVKDYNPPNLADFKKKILQLEIPGYGTKIVKKTRNVSATYKKKTTLAGYGIYEQTSSGGTETYYVVE